MKRYTFALFINTLKICSVAKILKSAGFYNQSEGLPYNLSIEEYCLKQGVPVNEFNKWYKDTHKRIRPIQVDGIPSAIHVLWQPCQGRDVSFVSYLHRNLPDDGIVCIKVFQESLCCHCGWAYRL